MIPICVDKVPCCSRSALELTMEFYLSFTDLLSKFPNPIILVFLPIFIFTILAEALVIQARHGSYSWKNTGVSTLVAVGHIVTQAAVHGLIFGVIAAGVYQVRLTTIPVSWHNWPSLIALFVLTELAFYVEHRCSHRIRLLWASHSVHHSTEHMVASASLTYQFFVHTELVKRIGWLDWIINTPSAHRVHHASNPEYIDKNFGGVLMIWDHLFGTYQAELPDVRIRYGLSHPRSSASNPFVIAYEDLWRMLKEVFGARSWRERLR